MTRDGRDLPAYCEEWLRAHGSELWRARFWRERIQLLVDACEPLGGLRWPDREQTTVTKHTHPRALLSLCWEDTSPDNGDHVLIFLKVYNGALSSTVHCDLVWDNPEGDHASVGGPIPRYAGYLALTRNILNPA